MTKNCTGRAAQTCNSAMIREHSTAKHKCDHGFQDITDEHDGTCLLAQYTQSICGAQVTAAMAGRSYVIPEDVVREAVPVLAHRISAVSGNQSDAEEYLRRKVRQAVVPLEDLNRL